MLLPPWRCELWLADIESKDSREVSTFQNVQVPQGGTQSLHLIFRVLYSKISTVPRATKSGAHGDAARTTGARA